ncbi:MAG: hypothetical protein M1115_08375 [Actinobacteria bacterium]|nr:hypothetical protein [Actinomycetota bacterium]
MAFFLSGSGASTDLAVYSLWGWVLAGYVISAAMVALVLAGLAVNSRRRKRSSSPSNPAKT